MLQGYKINGLNDSYEFIMKFHSLRLAAKTSHTGLVQPNQLQL